MKDKKNNGLTALVLIGAFFLFVIGVLLMFNGDKNDDHPENNRIEYSYEEFVEDFKDYNLKEYDINEKNYKYYINDYYTKKYSKMIGCEFKLVNKDAFLIVNNDTDEYIGRVNTSIVFYDENNQIIWIESVYVDEIEAGSKRIASIMHFPSEFARVDFYNELRKQEKEPGISTSLIKCELSEDKKAIITNKNPKKCERVSGYLLFYDEAGKVVDYSYVYDNKGFRPNESKDVKLNSVPKEYYKYEFFVSFVK